MKAKDRYVEGRIYTYNDLTEQEKSDAHLTMDVGVDPRSVHYRFKMLTPDEVRSRYDFDVVENSKRSIRVQRLLEDIPSAGGVLNAAIDREGNHRMAACAVLGVNCPWFEVISPDHLKKE